jgi:hypothetical protein
MHNEETWKIAARIIADDMPEYFALQTRLLDESLNVRRAVATLLLDSVCDSDNCTRLAAVRYELDRRAVH